MNARLTYSGKTSSLLEWIQRLQEVITEKHISISIPLIEGMKIEMQWSPEDV